MCCEVRVMLVRVTQSESHAVLLSVTRCDARKWIPDDEVSQEVLKYQTKGKCLMPVSDESAGV